MCVIEDDIKRIVHAGYNT